MSWLSNLFGGGDGGRSTTSSSSTVQQDQRTMAEQATNLVGPYGALAEPSSVIVGEGGTVGDISFTVQESAQSKDGVTSQLADVLRQSLAASPITPAPQTQQTGLLAGIDNKILLIAGAILLFAFMKVKLK